VDALSLSDQPQRPHPSTRRARKARTAHASPASRQHRTPKRETGSSALAVDLARLTSAAPILIEVGLPSSALAFIEIGEEAAARGTLSTVIAKSSA